MRPILHTEESDPCSMTPGPMVYDTALFAHRQVLQPMLAGAPCTAEDDASWRCLAPRGQAFAGKV